MFEGPLDIVGDVHGELEALDTLMARLGYSQEGIHPQGRRLIFVGDLCDRGPDSPGVLTKVASLVQAGLAQCVLGNHELNITLGSKKAGNHWFYGSCIDPVSLEYTPCVPVFSPERPAILEFLKSLPLVLERTDLRVVHAAWSDEAVAFLRTIEEPIDVAYEKLEEAIASSAENKDLREAALAMRAKYAKGLQSPNTQFSETALSEMAAIGAYTQFCQNTNSIRYVTSGPEKQTRDAFYANGKWRFAVRDSWWNTYKGTPVVFGHYWRWVNPAKRPTAARRDLATFSETGTLAMRAEDKAFCVDFCVGGRPSERITNPNGPFESRLGALRWPERELVFESAEHTPA